MFTQNQAFDVAKFIQVESAHSLHSQAPMKAVLYRHYIRGIFGNIGISNAVFTHHPKGLGAQIRILQPLDIFTARSRFQ